MIQRDYLGSPRFMGHLKCHTRGSFSRGERLSRILGSLALDIPLSGILDALMVESWKKRDSLSRDDIRSEFLEWADRFIRAYDGNVDPDEQVSVDRLKITVEDERTDPS